MARPTHKERKALKGWVSRRRISTLTGLRNILAPNLSRGIALKTLAQRCELESSLLTQVQAGAAHLSEQQVARIQTELEKVVAERGGGLLAEVVKEISLATLLAPTESEIAGWLSSTCVPEPDTLVQGEDAAKGEISRGNILVRVGPSVGVVVARGTAVTIRTAPQGGIEITVPSRHPS